MFVEMNGLSQIEEGGRVFVSSLTLWTAHPAYRWVNTLFAVLEGEPHGAPLPNEFRARTAGSTRAMRLSDPSLKEAINPCQYVLMRGQ